MNKISEIEPGTSVCHFTLNRGSNRFWRAHTRRERHTHTPTHTLPCEVSSPRARVPRGVVLYIDETRQLGSSQTSVLVDTRKRQQRHYYCEYEQYYHCEPHHEQSALIVTTASITREEKKFAHAMNV